MHRSRIDDTIAELNLQVADRPQVRRASIINDIDLEITRINKMLGNRRDRQGAQALARLIACEVKRRQDARS